MKKLRWQILIITLALVAILILLLGRQPVIQAVIPEPVKGGIYTEGLIGSMGRLNPVLDFYNLPDRDINRLLYSSLIRYDWRGLPEPELAESWGISQDGKTYNFSLRSNVFWHDGEPVTTEDIRYTIDTFLNPVIPLPEDVRSFWDEVVVNPLNDQTIQFILPEPFAPFLDYLTFGILPAHLVGDISPDEMIDAPFNLQPVGSGPYQFERFLVEAGDIIGVVLSASETYYVQRPFIDQIVFRYYSDAAAALDAYRQGEIQGISQLPTDVLLDALSETELNFYTSRLPQIYLIYLNLSNEDVAFFQNPALRAALLKGLNRQKMVDRIFQGQAIIANGPVFPDTWAYYEGLSQVHFDPEAAINTLRSLDFLLPSDGGDVREDEAGPLVFTLLYPDQEVSAQLAVEIQRDLANIGVGVSIEPISPDLLIEEHLSSGDYEAALVDLNLSRSPDPDPYPFWHQAQITRGQNYSQWDDRTASEFLEQARIIVDIGERARLYQNFQVRFDRELPALPLFYPVYTYAVDTEVQGLRIGPLFDPSDRFNHVEDWFLLAKRTIEEVVSETPTP